MSIYSFKISNKRRVPTLTISIMHSIRILDKASRQENEIKYIKTGNKKLNSLFADDMFLNKENAKHFNKTSIQLINESSKVVTKPVK